MSRHRPLTPARARALTSRAHAAFAVWVMLDAVLVGLAIAMVAQVLAGAPTTPPAVLPMVPALLWIVAWTLAVFGSVWWYRRGIHDAVTADDLATRERASRLVQVRPVFVIRELVGVDVAGLPRTRIVRLLDGPWPLVGHVGALALVLLAAALLR